MSDSGKNILLRFLEKDPNKRLGAGRHGKRGPEGGMSDIKEHPFFHPWIDWEMLEAKQVESKITTCRKFFLILKSHPNGVFSFAILDHSFN